MNLTVVVLAAGQGSRMKSSMPKVLHKFLGEPMLGYVIKNVLSLKPDKIIVVTGYQANQVEDYVHNNFNNIQVVRQKEQLGTGHALLQALPYIDNNSKVLTVLGDVPGLILDDVKALIASCQNDGLGILTTIINNPKGYGRIIRNEKNQVVKVVEEKNATNAQKLINEVNTGIVVADINCLNQYLPKVSINQVKQEYYLLDIIDFYIENKIIINAYTSSNSDFLFGVNSRQELHDLQKKMQIKILTSWLEKGVSIQDINRVDIRGDVEIGQDVFIDVNVMLIGAVKISSGAVIGPGVVLQDCIIGKNVTIKPYSVCENVVIKDYAEIGPFASLSQNTTIADCAYIGSFVEVKRSNIGQNVKAKHLAYIGDTIIEDNVNIGAGVITCNYDGANKHITKIKSDSFVGAAVTLIAPIIVENNAFIAAGTTLRVNAPAGKLTVAAIKPKFIENWRKPKKYEVTLK